jgi:hypothetical protein
MFSDVYYVAFIRTIIYKSRRLFIPIGSINIKCLEANYILDSENCLKIKIRLGNNSIRNSVDLKAHIYVFFTWRKEIWKDITDFIWMECNTASYIKNTIIFSKYIIRCQ